MSSYAVIRVLIGTAAPSPPTPDQADLYGWLAEQFLSAPRPTLTRNIPIPLTNDEIFRSSNAVHERLVDAGEQIPGTCNLLIVDLSTAAGEPRATILWWVVEVLRELQERHLANTRILLQVSTMLSERDMVLAAIRNEITSGTIAFIDDNGSTTPGGPPLPFADLYPLHLRRIRRDPIDLLRMKVIQRHGHFRLRHGAGRNGREAHYAYFYDARNCDTEITALLEKAVRTHAGRAPSIMVYLAHQSRWLADCVFAVKGRTGIDAVRASQRGDIAGLRPIIITDFVDTGETVLKEYRKVITETERTPLVITVLTSKPIDEAGTITVSDKHGAVRIQAFLSVQHERYRKDSCRLCRFHVPISSFTPEDYGMLTAYEMWRLHDPQSLKQEADVPSHRRSLGVVPDTPRMVRDHAPFIAYKAEHLLQRVGWGSADLTFLCPDENGTRLIAYYFSLLLGATIVRIPRNAIDTAHQSSARASWDANDPPWYRQLRGIRVREVILLDEMKSTGKTLDQLARIAEHAGLSVRGDFPLFDYSSLDAKTKRRTVTLYRLAYGNRS